MSSILAAGTKFFVVPDEHSFSSFQVENVHWNCMCAANQCLIKINKNKNKIYLRKNEFVTKKQNGGWKVSDADWFYFSFYDPSCFCFFYDPSLSGSNFISFLFFYSIRFGPSRSELIRPGLAVRVDPVRLLYLPEFYLCFHNSCKIWHLFSWASMTISLLWCYYK